MSDEEKGVTVYGSRHGRLTHLNYPTAATVSIQDGHLLVLGSSSPLDVVAAFSPNQWHSADVK